MNAKTIRYIAWLAGSLLAIALLFINDYSFSDYGLFASDINETMVYEFLKGIVREFGANSSTARGWAYFLWFVCLAGSIVLSWRHRYKSASVLAEIFKTIHEKT